MKPRLIDVIEIEFWSTRQKALEAAKGPGIGSYEYMEAWLKHEKASREWFLEQLKEGESNHDKQ